jgi:hypothetical protein
MLKTIFFLFIFKISSTLADCPTGTTQGFDENTCYLFSQTPLNFLDAVQNCVDNNALMVSVGNVFVNTFLTEKANAAFANFSGVSNFWLGGINQHPELSGWRWIDGTNFSYTNWNPGSPGAEVPLCITTSLSNGKWMSQDCAQTFYFVCELSLKTTTALDDYVWTPDPNYKWVDMVRFNSLPLRHVGGRRAEEKLAVLNHFYSYFKNYLFIEHTS